MREKRTQLFFLGLWGARGKEGNSALSSKASSLPEELVLAEVGLEEATLRKGKHTCKSTAFTFKGIGSHCGVARTWKPTQAEAAECGAQS